MSCFNLASQWNLRADKADFQTIPARVPGDNYSALLEAGVIPDPYLDRNEDLVQWVRECNWIYSRDFELDQAFLDQDSILLNIDSVDTFAEIRINGKVAGTSENMFRRLRLEVKPLLRCGVNHLEIVLFSPVRRAEEENEKQPYFVPFCGGNCNRVPYMNLIRKAQCHGGWDWGITLLVSGLYGDVSLRGIKGGVHLEHVYTEQIHGKGECRLIVHAELQAAKPGKSELSFLFHGEKKTVSAELAKGINKVSEEFLVRNPELWNPAGYGKQHLYSLEVSTGEETISRKIGLRKLVLVNEKDEIGVSMKFRVNDVDIFCKGANWIPMDAMPGRFSEKRYRQLLGDAVKANMNMIRVWGGGIYENECFYEVCDELGLLVWQDCMFACSQYPSQPHFLELVRAELNDQVKRLRDHACIALWCGDNEIARGLTWQKNKPDYLRYLFNYDRFNQCVSRAVQEADPTRTFWPTSPCAGSLDSLENPQEGDMHYWEVWHSGKSFSSYYDVLPRFCSEFGYQSFPCADTVFSYAGKGGHNLTSPVMEHHQRNNQGNSRILEMFTRYFRFPDGFENMLYLSQVQQALAIRTGVEYWRHLKPVCMGALYWQLNDNWPVASWSSIDYYGNWKQLHYQARRFYAPVIVTCYQNRENRLEIWVSSDLQKELSGSLKLSVFDFKGTVKRSLVLPVHVPEGAALKIREMEQTELADRPEEVFAFLELELSDGERMYRHSNDHFFTEYKHCELLEPEITTSLASLSPDGTEWKLTLHASHPAFYVFAELRGFRTVFSDNSFTLLPDRPRELTFRLDSPAKKEELEQSLVVYDLRSSYSE